ncbi:ABC transporter permease [Streptomyces katsurahamanus]|uniref:ABC transporter permease n=1 Tax=Streptomyces katsurahamanus TaxID=2577098 RepID=A0ABW9NVY9_9ACTN|nr:ABC transporter permease [Streptomyces katsurahamanus]MQS37319.1 ABC transporter permease [Streptomyces katsurahamanus]
MNLFKRAWWRLTSHLGKTVMLVGLFFVICTLVLSGFLIRSAAARAAEDAKDSVGAVATMQLDVNALIGSGQGTESNGSIPGTIGPGGDLRRGLVDRICESPVVKRCNYTTDSGAAPTGGSKLYRPVPRPAGTAPDGLDLFKADGVRDQQSVDSFRNGDAKMVAGRGIGPKSKSDEVVVEQRLAQHNRWKVGDRIRLKVGELPEIGKKRNEDAFGFTVVGVYASGTPDTGQYVPAMMEPVNQLYVTPDGATRLLGKKPGDGGGVVDQATFTLSDPADMDRLKKHAEARGADLDIFPMTVNDKQYKQLVGPITRTADFATVTVWIVALAGTVILALIVASSLRERRKELGILLSLGEKKPKLLGQHLVEVVACAVIAVGLASAGSQFLSETMGGRMLAGEVSSAKDSAANVDNGPDPSAVTGAGGAIPLTEDAPEVEPIDSLDVRLGAADIAKVGATGLGIAVLATLIPGARVLRLNPRDILTKGD